MFNIGWSGIKTHNQAIFFCLGGLHFFDFIKRVGDKVFNFFQTFRGNCTAIVIAHFKPIVAGGVVRSGDIDSARGLFINN